MCADAVFQSNGNHQSSACRRSVPSSGNPCSTQQEALTYTSSPASLQLFVTG